MKKTFLLLTFCIFAATFVVCATLLESCRKKQCYEPMYDNPPALSDTGYNTCKTIVYNFRTYSGDGRERLISMDHRDTIKVFGYVTNCTNRYALNCQYSLVDEPIVSGAQSNIELPLEYWTIPDSIDLDFAKICYVTGCIAFEEERKNFMKPNPCDIFFPKIHPIEYHFE